MLPNTPIINVDVDGVLYDFTGAMRREVKAVMGITGEDLHDPSQWSIHKDWPITGKQFHSIMEDGIAQGRIFRRGDTVEDVWTKRSMQHIMDLGWHVRIVTSKTFRDPFITMQARKSTLDWIYENEIPHHTLAFSDSSIGKRTYMADAVVDDKPSIEWVQWGAFNFLYDQPWNKTVETGELDIIRVNGMMEVFEALKGDPWHE